jgi:hypothetical protein
MPHLGFETTITMFEQAKTIYALDHAATVISTSKNKVNVKSALDFINYHMC